MMKLIRIAGLMLACAVLPAAAQTQPVQTMRPADQSRAVQTIEIDYKTQYQQAVEKNKQLRSEIDGLKSQIAAYSTRGGSLVRAYCESPSTSRNTAGDGSNCNASGNVCEEVSGLCRTTCQTSDMCAGGFVCDTEAQRCVVPGSGE